MKKFIAVLMLLAVVFVFVPNLVDSKSWGYDDVVPCYSCGGSGRCSICYGSGIM